MAELIYWHLSGGFDPGASVSLFKGNAAAIAAAVAEAEAALARLIDAFDDPARPYLSHPHPGARAALRRLRATGAGGGMVGGRGGGVTPPTPLPPFDIAGFCRVAA